MLHKNRKRTARTVPEKLAIALSGTVFFVGGVAAGEDWQYWSTWTASCRLSEGTAVKFLADSYFRGNMSDDYLHDQYLGVEHAVGNGFGALLSVQHVSVQDASGDWNSAWNAVPGVSYGAAIPGLCTLKLQDRFYYRFDPDSTWDHHRPRIDLSRAFGPIKLTLSDEIRMDLAGTRERLLYQNRIQAMVSKTLAKAFTLGVAYVRQSDRKNGRWESVNVLQTVVGFSFR